MTNSNFIKSLHETSTFGNITEAFIIEAIAKYCDDWLKFVPTKEVDQYISMELWQEIAAEIKQKIERRHK